VITPLWGPDGSDWLTPLVCTRLNRVPSPTTNHINCILLGQEEYEALRFGALRETHGVLLVCSVNTELTNQTRCIETDAESIIKSFINVKDLDRSLPQNRDLPLRLVINMTDIHPSEWKFTQTQAEELANKLDGSHLRAFLGLALDPDLLNAFFI
jgi:hypothetical protein